DRRRQLCRASSAAGIITLLSALRSEDGTLTPRAVLLSSKRETSLPFRTRVREKGCAVMSIGLSTGLAILSFIVVIGPLIFFHELGHFAVARLFKIKVEEFGIGYPPRMVTLFER